jgi:hypothetical protein
MLSDVYMTWYNKECCLMFIWHDTIKNVVWCVYDMIQYGMLFDVYMTWYNKECYLMFIWHDTIRNVVWC